MRSSLMIFWLGSLALIGCAAPEEEETSGKWAGETPHVTVRGTLNGERLDFSITGDAVAAGAEAWCSREYVATQSADGVFDLANARQDSTEIDGYATVNGEERFFELEFRSHTFEPEEVGSAVAVAPRVDGTTPGKNATFVDFEWHTADREGDLYEASALEGRLELELYTGTPGDGGVVIPPGDGMFGGLLDARWSADESLTVSFTVPCIVSEVEAE